VYPNIFLLPANFRGTWGGMTLVYYELLIMKFAIENCKGWTYFILLSGNDVAVKSITYINNFFYQSAHANISSYLFYFEMKPNHDSYFRITSCYVDCIGMHKIPDCKYNTTFISDKIMQKGCQWKVLRYDLVYFILKSEKLWEYITFFRTTFVPDEHLILTLLVNEMKLMRSHALLSYIDWGKPALELSKSDLEKAIAQKNHLWARKVYSTTLSRYTRLRVTGLLKRVRNNKNITII